MGRLDEGLAGRVRRPQGGGMMDEEERGTFILKCNYMCSTFDLIIHRCYRR